MPTRQYILLFYLLSLNIFLYADNSKISEGETYYLKFIEQQDINKSQALVYLKRAVESGHQGAILALAFCYMYGDQKLDIEIDKKTAVVLLKKLAMQGHVDAFEMLVKEYLDHHDKDLKPFLCNVHNTHKSDSGKINYLMALILVCSKDESEKIYGMKMINSASDNGIIMAKQYLAETYFNQGKYEFSIKLYKELADLKYPLSYSRLADFYRKGLGCKRDIGIAENYEKMANQNRTYCLSQDGKSIEILDGKLIPKRQMQVKHTSYCDMDGNVHYGISSTLEADPVKSDSSSVKK